MAVDTDTEVPQSLAALYAQRANLGLAVQRQLQGGKGFIDSKLYAQYQHMRTELQDAARTYARAWTWPTGSLHAQPPRLGHKEAE